MLRHSIAGVGVCRLLPGRTEKQYSILAGHNSKNTLYNRTPAASFQLRWPCWTSKVSRSRFAVPYSVLVWREDREDGKMIET